MFAVGHASIVNPPEVPHPVTPKTSAFGVKVKVEVVATPVMVTVTAVVQVLAAIAVVPTVVVVLAMTAVQVVVIIPDAFVQVTSPLQGASGIRATLGVVSVAFTPQPEAPATVAGETPFAL